MKSLGNTGMARINEDFQGENLGSALVKTIGANQTSSSFANPGSLKGKLVNFEDSLKGLKDEMAGHKNELSLLKTDKDTLRVELDRRNQELKMSLVHEIRRMEEDMKSHFNSQKQEHGRLQQQLNGLKNETTEMQKLIIGLQRQITEIERQVGSELT
eukprot:TRINITY_DN1528_c0_g2_i1.p1 TRINITY_DN1528_c0_g2~~TRINITY_DN1528_c0_g2_i1.p1  ORF type:complete len:157 (-),score=33.69 TRINITY_DN1528_c0_g2_i1:102-572(-)